MTAERIVSGSVPANCRRPSVPSKAEAGEMVVKDLATKKTLTVRVNSDSTMRKLPRQWRQHGHADTTRRRDWREYRPGLGPPPAMPLSELKPGDAIMLSSTTGSDPGAGHGCHAAGGR